MALATHIKKTTGEFDLVIIGALRVVITQEDKELWAAQGVEIDFAACGVSLSDVQQRFEAGLSATIHANIKRFGSFERILKWAPMEEIEKISALSEKYDFTSMTMHQFLPETKLPFTNIAYIMEKQAA